MAVLEKNVMLSLAEKAVALALQKGAAEAEAFVYEGQATNIGIELGQISKTSRIIDRGIGIRVIINKTVGFAYTNITNNYQQADTGTKMIHIGRDTHSTIVSKGISAGHGSNAYRGLVKVLPTATNARNHTQCDSLLMSDHCAAHTFPYIEVKNPSATVEHEATTSKIGDDQLFYLRSRGLSEEDAVNLIVNGFCKEVFKELPMEFAVEAQKLLAVSLEGAIG